MDGRISVVTTIFPPYDFVREIAGDEVDLTMLLKPGEETHSYEPTPQDIIAIQNSDVFIYTGGENDVWVEDISQFHAGVGYADAAPCQTVWTRWRRSGVEGMKGSGGHSHAHEESGEEAHDGHAHAHGHEEESVHEIDEHVWTSPVNASLIAEQIADVALAGRSVRKRAVCRKNALAYQEKLVGSGPPVPG